MYPDIPLKFQLDRLNLTPVRARGKSDSKTDRQKQDRQTDRHRRIVQNHFSRSFGGCTSQIRSYLEVDFLHDANTSIDMEVKWCFLFALSWKAPENRGFSWKCCNPLYLSLSKCSAALTICWKQKVETSRSVQHTEPYRTNRWAGGRAYLIIHWAEAHSVTLQWGT